MTTLGKRLRQVRGRETRERAGERLDLHPNTLQKYENDQRIPDADFIVKFCATYQVDARWLLTGEGTNLPTLSDVSREFTGTPDMGMVPVPFYDVRAAGALQIESDKQPAKHIYLPQQLFLMRGIRPASARLMLYAGTSMEPTIADGDLILLDVSDKNRSDGIFMIGRDGGLLVKRLQWRADGSLIMLSDNRAFDAETLLREDAQGLRVIGRVRMAFKGV